MSVFHLKYRPSRLSDIDLVDVAESLRKYIIAKEMPQSFLFSGPKGSGKTSSARILAKAVNCLNSKDGEACGKCENCKEIEKGSSIDVIEMDAASNRGIEDVRGLKDKAYLLPSKLKRKVFIIDEVHMLTKDAFNALLKLIEEPPKHTIFVLCTTDAEKIPETVLSRLVKINFRKGGKKELISSLKKIIEGEGIEIAKEAIDFIIEKSDGSFRNLQRSFNELYLQLGKKLSFEDVSKFYFNKSGDFSEGDFDNQLAKGEVKVILEKLEKMAESGIDFSDFRLSLMNYFQKKILSSFGIGEKIDGGLNLKETEEFINILVRVSKMEKDMEIDQLPMELAVIEFLGEKKNDENGAEIKTEEIKSEEIKEEEIIEQVCDCTLEITRIEEKWGNLLTVVKPLNYAVEAFLRATKPKAVKGNILMLEVFYPFHKDRLEEAKNRKIVEDGITKVYGVRLGFECVLSKNKREPLVIKNDTPVEHVSEKLAEEGKKQDGGDIYDVAKEIFG